MQRRCKTCYEIAGVLIVGAFSCTRAVPVSELAARVNGEPVTKAEFETTVSQNLARYERAGHSLDERVKNRIRESVLRRIIDRKVIEIEAKKLGLEVTDADIEKRFTEQKSRWRDAEQFDAYLKRSKNTIENMKRELARSMLRERVVQTLAGDVDVTDEQVKTYYDENAERFVKKERVRVSRILKRVPETASDQEKLKLKSELTRLAAEAAKDGASFAELAREHSDGGEASRGGELSWLERGRMSPEFDQAAFSVAPGGVSEVIQTPAGFELLKIWERNPEVRRTLDEVKATIRSSLEARERNSRRRSVLNDLKKEAKVEKFVDFSEPAVSPEAASTRPGSTKAPAKPVEARSSSVKPSPERRADDK